VPLRRRPLLHAHPAAGRCDVRHARRADRASGQLPLRCVHAVAPGVELRGVPEPGLRLPVPARRVVRRHRRDRCARLDQPAVLVGADPDHRVRGRAPRGSGDRAEGHPGAPRRCRVRVLAAAARHARGADRRVAAGSGDAVARAGRAPAPEGEVVAATGGDPQRCGGGVHGWCQRRRDRGLPAPRDDPRRLGPDQGADERALRGRLVRRGGRRLPVVGAAAARAGALCAAVLPVRRERAGHDSPRRLVGGRPQ
jgi:hypothetical protein